MVRSIAALALLIAGTRWAGAEIVDARLAPAQMAVGEASNLTISASGDTPRITPPVVPGLEFTPVGQSRRVEVVNGAVSSTFSLTYRVTADKPGTYVIANIAPGVKPLVLKVDAQPSAAGSAQSPSAAAVPASPAGGDRAAGDGSAFVRLIVPAHQLFVGQSVPVEIQVGTHDGVVASLNGLPSLNGDAFTLDKLAPEPEQRTAETIDGKPFTVFTWHGVLAAIKPGTWPLRMETPLTVRIPLPRPSARFSDESTLEDVFDDPAFQGFFGGTTEKDITVSSPATDLTVLELPTEGRPKDFTGAVGRFRVESDLAARQFAAGDPVTLRMTVSGEGSFDRVDSPMLADGDHWKTYRPTGKFAASGGTAYRGVKTFEQPIVATEPGSQTVPALSFSYFDPLARRYETIHTEPIAVEVRPAQSPGSSAAATAAVSAAAAAAPTPAADSSSRGTLRPDHALSATGSQSLRPHYAEPGYLAVPAALLLAFPALWFGLARRGARRGAAEQAAALSPQQLLAELDRSAAAGDVPRFLCAARTLVQQSLAARWRMPAAAVTLTEVETRLGHDSDLRLLFALADEVRYAGRGALHVDFDHWRHIVLGELQRELAA